MTDQEKAELNELGEYMEQEMMRVFSEGGYAVSKIADFDDFTHGKNEYLMTFVIDKYEPARLNAPEEQGFGEGGVAIDTYVELFGDSDQPRLKKRQGFSTSRGWKFCVQELNRITLPEVSERIHELQETG